MEEQLNQKDDEAVNVLRKVYETEEESNSLLIGVKSQYEIHYQPYNFAANQQKFKEEQDKYQEKVKAIRERSKYGHL